MGHRAETLSSQTGLLEALAEFRYALRSFLRFSEQAAHGGGLHPQQHQLLLQIAGMSGDHMATIGFLAERLGLRPNSVVELTDRSVAEGLVRRTEDPADRRRVVLSLSAKGSRLLETLSASHARELDEFGPRLIRALEQIGRAREKASSKSGARSPRSAPSRASTQKRDNTAKRLATPVSRRKL